MGPPHLFPFEKHHVLDSGRRKRHQPPERLINLVLAERPRTVIDLGAGTGYFAIPLARALPNGLVLAVDADPRMLRLIRERADAERLGSHLQTVAAVAGKHPLPLGGEIADAVFSVSLYHELEQRKAVLRELARLLRPGGRVILCDWDPGTDPALGGPPPSHRVPAARAVTELETAGYAHARTVDLYPGFWTVTAVRGSRQDAKRPPA